MFISYDGGVDGEDLVSHYYEGTEYPAYFEFTFAEEEYFDGYDDRYTCSWWGSPSPNGLSDLSLGDNIWVGWDMSLQVIDTDCTSFDPELWGDETPTSVIESMDFGYGFGPTSDDFKGEIVDNWGVDWTTDWEPYVFSGFVAWWSDKDDALFGSETNYSWNFQVDDAWELVTETGDDGYDYLVYEPAPTEAPRGYVRSNAFWGWDGAIY